MLNRTRSFSCLAIFWLIGIMISLPYLWMTVFNTNPDQCELNMSFKNLIYVMGLNAIIIFIPVIVLVALYITIIIKSWNNYRNHIKKPYKTLQKPYTQWQKPYKQKQKNNIQKMQKIDKNKNIETIKKRTIRKNTKTILRKSKTR